MSAFYVGQRVKKVRGDSNIGVTGVVVAVGFWEYDSEGYTLGNGGADVQIKPDNAWVSTTNESHPPGYVGYSSQWEWEPILPEGWQPVEWADCLWQPEGIAA